MLYYPYDVKKGDNLSKIAKKFGFRNPGPIYAFPSNKSLFNKRKNKGSHLLPGDKILIPWHKNHIEKVLQTCRHLIKEIQKDKEKFLKEELQNVTELETFLVKIDAINFLANIGVNLSSMAIKGMKNVAMSSKEALSWLLNDRVKMGADILSTFAIDAPKGPKRDFRFYVRHTLGPWNPSFWASVIVAVKRGDVDTYLYGPRASYSKNVDRIRRQTQKDILRLENKITALEKQKSKAFYNRRI